MGFGSRHGRDGQLWFHLIRVLSDDSLDLREFYQTIWIVKDFRGVVPPACTDALKKQLFQNGIMQCAGGAMLSNNGNKYLTEVL